MRFKSISSVAKKLLDGLKQDDIDRTIERERELGPAGREPRRAAGPGPVDAIGWVTHSRAPRRRRAMC
jgi:hypothetical protein